MPFFFQSNWSFWSTVPLFMLECFKENVKSPGHQIIEKPFKPTYSKIQNASDCQEKYCQQIPSCQYFAYNADTKTCNLKTKHAIAEPTQKSTVFGPKYCPEPYSGKREINVFHTTIITSKESNWIFHHLVKRFLPRFVGWQVSSKYNNNWWRLGWQ